jgi:Family of unknown function (DUF6441)
MVNFKVTSNASALVQTFRDKERRIAKAATAALRETASIAVKEGRSNIASSGRFGARWQKGLQYRMLEAEEGKPLGAKVLIFHKFGGMAGAFEFGATIQGKPLLWIPTTPGAPRARRSGKKLTSATVRGQPMLFDANDRDPARKPLYVGVPQVHIRKRWDIIEIVKRRAAQIATVFIKHFKDD